MKKSTILFDLDGTLVNTREGVTKSVQYALEKFGIYETDQKTLQRFIGPPLMESFRREYGFSVEKSKEAINFFRERYEKTGVYECELYREVESVLKAFQEKGRHLSVASSKREESCQLILEHLRIAHYFDLIGGARLKLGTSTKIQVLEDVLERLGIQDRSQVVLIGDTKYDAIGAKEAGVDCIGITYGFEQDFDAMRNAGVLGIFDSLSEVVDFLEET